MAVTNTSDYLPTGGLLEVAQMTSSDGTNESSALITGSSNGKRIKEVRVFSGSGVSPCSATMACQAAYTGATRAASPRVASSAWRNRRSAACRWAGEVSSGT